MNTTRFPFTLNSDFEISKFRISTSTHSVAHEASPNKPPGSHQLSGSPAESRMKTMKNPVPGLEGDSSSTSQPTSYANNRTSTLSRPAMNTTSDTKSKRTNSRPETTDVVARRMIFSALGLKMPKKTEEQRAHDRAMREEEMRRKNEARAAAARANEEAEKAKVAVWDTYWDGSRDTEYD